MPTAPCHEEVVARFVRSHLRALALPFREDRHGNIVVELRSTPRRTAVAFVAHMDHPGFEVGRVRGRSIECSFLGGLPPACVRKGVAVEFFDASGYRIAIGRVHRIEKWERRDKRVRVALQEGEVQRGQFGMWKLPGLRFDSASRRLFSRACDDLAGCAAILGTLSALVRGRHKARLYAIFTRREEIGLQGAYEVARSHRLPRAVPVISIETSKMLPNAPQGAGPIVRVGDRATIFDPGLTGRLCDIARRLEATGGTPFRFQRKLMDGGTCEATAWQEAGYAAGGLCVALGNYHNCGQHGRIAAEHIRLDDWHGMVRLMTVIAQKFALL